MRGRVSYIGQRYSKHNSELWGYFMKTNFQYILHTNANNLHAWEMIQYLPTQGIKWLTYDEINKFDVNEDEDGDLQYPEKLHDLHNRYPVALEKIQVRKVML